MILSMTGFAVATRDVPGGTLTVEIRTVNHRYLDLQLRLPDELRSLETGLRERLSAELKRGKVDFRMGITRATAQAANLAVDVAAIEQLATVAEAVSTHVPSAAPLSIHEILRWPGVLAEASLAPEQLASAAHALVDQALAELRASRAREGAKLAALIAQRCADVVAQVERVAPRLPQIQAAFSEKLAQRMREAGLSGDDERLKQEFALFATRIDVDEEVSRLLAHVAEVRRILDAGGSAGKRLDFLMQELNREANTLGSKSIDSELSRVAIELKVLIEQMREQVQNIE